MTPDSSRFWEPPTYEPGRAQASFDKQFVRDWLETPDWDKTAPGPELPAEVVAGTRARYVEAYERITGASFDALPRRRTSSPDDAAFRFAVNVMPARHPRPAGPGGRGQPAAISASTASTTCASGGGSS